VSRIVGIDLGTTNSLVATVDSGIPLVIADAQGRRLTPSVVHYSSPGSAATVGEAARRVRALEPRSTIYSVKRFIGRRRSDLLPEEMQIPYELGGDGEAPLSVKVPGGRRTPEEISAEVLKKLKQDAEAYFGEPVTHAVITVPAYFNDGQRSATKRAGELAGFTVERIINEPTAAALACGLDKLGERARVAVYDLGGGTFDLSILEMNEGVFQVLATNGNTRLGGDDIDRRLCDFLSEKVRAAGGPDPAGEVTIQSRLLEAAEAAKIQLSSADQAVISLPFLAGEFSFQFTLGREQLEEISREIIGRTREHCLRALADAKLEAAQLDQVILVGGQTRMPLVRKVVSELFHCVEFSETRGTVRIGENYHRGDGPVLNTSQNPDEAVALGAAIQAEILSGGFKNMLLLDVTPLSLGLETFGGLMNVLIHRNSTIPIKAGEAFTTAVDNQRSMLIHVLQGERERAKDNWSLGRFTIDFPKAPRGVPRVGVQFEIDANGILHVLARDLQSGRETVVRMSSAVDVNDADVQRMVEESVEHAFEDMAARQWIEASLRAKETLAATCKGLEEFGASLGMEQREDIESALDEVKKSLDAGGQAGQPADVQKLKSAIAALDEATRPLADLMMDQAMAGLLRQRGLLKD